MRALALGAVIVLLLLIILWQYESDHITYWLRCNFSSGMNQSGAPTPASIRARVCELIDGLPAADNSVGGYTFIDFGCGEGSMLEAVHGCDKLDLVLGVELDPELAACARARFADSPFVRILTQNMADFVFPGTSVVLYMYEPLWCMHPADALPIYRRVLDGFDRARRQPAAPATAAGAAASYIIYVSGVHPMLDAEFFAPYGAKPVQMSRARRGLGWPGNRIWLFSLIT
jgi:hypothetical protein